VLRLEHPGWGHPGPGYPPALLVLRLQEVDRSRFHAFSTRDPIRAMSTWSSYSNMLPLTDWSTRVCQLDLSLGRGIDGMAKRVQREGVAEDRPLRQDPGKWGKHMLFRSTLREGRSKHDPVEVDLAASLCQSYCSVRYWVDADGSHKYRDYIERWVLLSPGPDACLSSTDTF
jgi:hypothetical protein